LPIVRYSIGTTFTDLLIYYMTNAVAFLVDPVYGGGQLYTLVCNIEKIFFPPLKYIFLMYILWSWGDEYPHRSPLKYALGQTYAYLNSIEFMVDHPGFLGVTYNIKTLTLYIAVPNPALPAYRSQSQSKSLSQSRFQSLSQSQFQLRSQSNI